MPVQLQRILCTFAMLVWLCAGSTSFAIAEDRSDDAAMARSPDHSTVVTVLLYPVNRILDIFDIFRINLGFGPGYGINVRATKLLQAGVESYSTLRVGLGKESGIWSPRYGIVYTESELLTAGASLAYMGGRQRGTMEVGTTVHLGLIGAEGAIDLAEIADFFLGFAMIDFKEDDH
ncbi:MAG TPA: hypothetical protein EYN60_04105 [Nitrospirales bacterium]|nr:hypothetical protein [Nitrospirales bacterium]HIA13727.1 hypothetical protein [Nitrospirales bacterium]HIB54413.1 hypothetical protein [Nitrospirales bacterium]HIC05287.1 hypothetical protein [Nitrospirales bacterium]HIN33841.1 hypothetical protein [Nitrospirales bacterium]